MPSDNEGDLDDFLDLLENGDDSVGEENSIVVDGVLQNKNLATENSSSSPPRKALQDLTYEDIFGSPEKKKRKTDKDEDSTKTIEGGCFGSTAMFHLGSKPVAPSQIKNFSGPSDIAPVLIDHFSRLRLYRNSITLYHEGTTPELALQNRNFGLEFVNLLTMAIWYKTKGANIKNFWTCGVLSRKQPGVRTSAKGNEYAVWEINDLKQLDKSWGIFLFSSAANSSMLNSIPIGSVIDITTPSIMDSNNGPMKLSVNNSSQINHIGTAKDFGLCQSKKKDGNKCTAVVNIWECCTCIHHAASELKKMRGGGGGNGKGKGGQRGSKGKPGVSFAQGTVDNFPPKTTTREEDIFTVNFGIPMSTVGKKVKAPPFAFSSAIPSSVGKSWTRMELQGTSVCNELKRNTLSTGNANSISFKKEDSNFLSSVPALPPVAKKQMNLDPLKTRHLTDRDREILAALGGGKDPKKEKESKKSKSSADSQDGDGDLKKKKADALKEQRRKIEVPEIAAKIASDPTAGSRNMLKYLTGDTDKKFDYSRCDPHDTTRKEAEPISLSRETMRHMKQALDLVKAKGPIKKVDPNAVKRKSLPTQTDPKSSANTSTNVGASSKKRMSIEVEFDFESEDFKKVLNAKSAHEEHLQDVQEGEYFDKLEKKEAIENKLLNTFSVATNAVMCKKCKYVALGQSDFCKESQHQIRVVKATKRFFKCQDCGNRTMSLDRLPKHPCKQCRSSSWISAPVGKEKKGPVLASEVLAIRGHEEKFIGASGSKMFLNLEVS